MSKNSGSSPATRETKRTSKYDWVDTASTTHQLFVDPFNQNHARRTWIILTVVTVLAVLCGWYFIAQSPEPSPRHEPSILDSKNSDKLFVESGDITVPTEGILAVTSDGYGKFYVADTKGLSCFDIAGTVVKSWSYEELMLFDNESNQPQPLSGTVSSLCFVPKTKGPASLADQLLVALGSKVCVLKVTEEDNNLYSLPVQLQEDAMIAGLCADSKYVFLADWKNQVIVRFNPELPNDALAIGLPDESTGFPGFRLAQEPVFDIDVSGEDHLLYASNPGLFQIAVFSPETGQWIKDRSWDRRPWAVNGFSGLCNPVGLDLFSAEYLVASERGKNPCVRLFTTGGQEKQGLIRTNEADTRKTATLLFPLVVNDNTILIFEPDSKVHVFIRRPVPVESSEKSNDEK